MSFTYVLENLTHLTKSSVDVSKYILTHWLGTSSYWSTGCCCIPGLWLWKNPLPSIHSSSPWSSWKITSDLQCWYPVHGKKVDFEFCANKRALSSSSGHTTDEEQGDHWSSAQATTPWAEETLKYRSCDRNSEDLWMLMSMAKFEDRTQNPQPFKKWRN